MTYTNYKKKLLPYIDQEQSQLFISELFLRGEVFIDKNGKVIKTVPDKFTIKPVENINNLLDE